MNEKKNILIVVSTPEPKQNKDIGQSLVARGITSVLTPNLDNKTAIQIHNDIGAPMINVPDLSPHLQAGTDVNLADRVASVLNTSIRPDQHTAIVVDASVAGAILQPYSLGKEFSLLPGDVYIINRMTSQQNVAKITTGLLR